MVFAGRRPLGAGFFIKFSGQTGKETLNHLSTHKKTGRFSAGFEFTVLIIFLLLYFETYIFNRVDCFR